jgi:hypothetical protein
VSGWSRRFLSPFACARSISCLCAWMI